jgi:hypothetical protein
LIKTNGQTSISLSKITRRSKRIERPIEKLSKRMLSEPAQHDKEGKMKDRNIKLMNNSPMMKQDL